MKSKVLESFEKADEELILKLSKNIMSSQDPSIEELTWYEKVFLGKVIQDTVITGGYVYADYRETMLKYYTDSWHYWYKKAAIQIESTLRAKIDESFTRREREDLYARAFEIVVFSKPNHKDEQIMDCIKAMDLGGWLTIVLEDKE